MNKVILTVEGMSCGHCINAITNALDELEGVQTVAVDLDNKTVTVEYDLREYLLEKIKLEIAEQGYEIV